jgi:hypothetical protein
VHGQIAFLFANGVVGQQQMTEFPPPWSVQELDACFVVTDGNRQKLAYVYFEDDPGRRSAAKLLSRDQALRVAGQLREAAGVIAHDMLGF